MRFILLLAAAGLLAGCGAFAARGHSPTPGPSKPPHAVGARFSHAPAMKISASHNYAALVKTSDGQFTITLLPKVAPLAVNNFIFLARHHYYNHNEFFRIIADFMVQTGDPSNTSFGGPGYTFPDEKVTMRYRPGIVAMANRGANSNGSQFFIVTGPKGLGLPRSYTIFGRVSSGMNVVMRIANSAVVPNPAGELSQPLSPVWMKTVTIRESP